LEGGFLLRPKPMCLLVLQVSPHMPRFPGGVTAQRASTTPSKEE
jgi:hypothetical protein